MEMPAKRRNSKRRTSSNAEVEAWSDLFTCGYDFFGDLEPWGFPRNNDADRAARAAAPEAWQRLGAAFLENWSPHPAPGQRQTPWAVEEFGYPKGYRHAG